MGHVEEWHFEDNPHPNNTCRECGWNRREDGVPGGGLGHRAGCELDGALRFLERITGG